MLFVAVEVRVEFTNSILEAFGCKSWRQDWIVRSGGNNFLDRGEGTCLSVPLPKLIDKNCSDLGQAALLTQRILGVDVVEICPRSKVISQDRRVAEALD